MSALIVFLWTRQDFLYVRLCCLWMELIFFLPAHFGCFFPLPAELLRLELAGQCLGEVVTVGVLLLISRESGRVFVVYCDVRCETFTNALYQVDVPTILFVEFFLPWKVLGSVRRPFCVSWGACVGLVFLCRFPASAQPCVLGTAPPAVVRWVRGARVRCWAWPLVFGWGFCVSLWEIVSKVFFSWDAWFWCLTSVASWKNSLFSYSGASFWLIVRPSQHTERALFTPTVECSVSICSVTIFFNLTYASVVDVKCVPVCYFQWCCSK